MANIYKIEGKYLKAYQTKTFASDNYEQQMEEWLWHNDHVLFEGERILWIGRQLRTKHGKIADLVGLDENGNGIIVELKRGITPREIIAQALEYATWFSSLREDEIEALFIENKKDGSGREGDLRDAFFGFYEKEIQTFNQTQRVVIIGEEISEEVKDVVRYLRKYGLDIYCWKFSYYVSDKSEAMLSIEMEVGSETVGEKTSLTQKFANQDPSKKTTKQLFKNFVKRLNEEFPQITAKVPSGFRVWQSRPYDMTCGGVFWFQLESEKISLVIYKNNNEYGIALEKSDGKDSEVLKRLSENKIISQIFPKGYQHRGYYRAIAIDENLSMSEKIEKLFSEAKPLFVKLLKELELI